MALANRRDPVPGPEPPILLGRASRHDTRNERVLVLAAEQRTDSLE